MYSESGRKFNRTKTGCNLFPGLRDKGATHGVRHGKTDVQREHHMAWNAWKGCCKKVDSKVNNLQVFTIDFSEIQFIVNHNSQSDGQNQSAKSGMNLR